jgi:hypothetical protein
MMSPADCLPIVSSLISMLADSASRTDYKVSEDFLWRIIISEKRFCSADSNPHHSKVIPLYPISWKSNIRVQKVGVLNFFHESSLVQTGSIRASLAVTAPSDEYIVQIGATVLKKFKEQK